MSCYPPAAPVDPVAALRQELTVLRVEFDVLSEKIERSESARFGERLARLELLSAAVDLSTFIQEFARLRAQVVILNEWRERMERTKQRFWLGVAACLLWTAFLGVLNVLTFLLLNPG